MLDGVVADELQLRGIAQLKGAAQLPAEETGGGFEALEDILFLGLVQDTDIDPGIAQVAGGIHPGDGDHSHLRDPGVFQAAELVTELPLDLLVDAADSVA